jgi:hypothetical protein
MSSVSQVRSNFLVTCGRTIERSWPPIGFNYDIDALGATEKPNELNVAFVTVLSAIEKIGIFFALQVWIPALRLVVSANHTFVHDLLGSRPLFLIAQRSRTQGPSCPMYNGAHR